MIKKRYRTLIKSDYIQPKYYLLCNPEGGGKRDRKMRGIEVGVLHKGEGNNSSTKNVRQAPLAALSLLSWLPPKFAANF